MKIVHRGNDRDLWVCHHEQVKGRMLKCPECGVRRGHYTYGMPPVKLFLKKEG